jgi:hypothetical protein
VGRDEQNEIGGAVDLGQAILRHPPEQAHTLGDAAVARQLFDAGAFGPLADDHEFDFRQAGECLDHQPLPLQRHQVADCKKAGPCKAEGTSCRLTVVGPEQRQIYTVAKNAHVVGADTELDQPLLQPAGDRDQTVGMLRRPTDPSARHRVLCDDIEIAASGGDDDGAIDRASEQNGSDAVRIKVVGIDQIEVVTVANLTAQKWQHRGAKGERRCAHPDPGKYRITRMLDVQPVPRLLTRDAGKYGIPPQPRGREREPRAGRHDTGADDAARNKIPQTRRDENPVLGLQQVWI